MPIATVLIAVAAGFSDYPAFLDPQAVVESIIDHGPVYELIVKCPSGTAIVSYSKVERSFCTPSWHCGPSLPVAIRKACG